MRCHPLVLLCILAVIGSSSAQAGTFQHSDLPLFDPYIVVHPAGYDGTGGNLQIHICSAPETRFAVLSAISHWNALERTIGNCTGCRLWEEGSSGSDAPFSMESVMLHEFGHCAMGIDHINWIVGAQQTSYTHGVDVSFYTDGVDGIRGSSDDGVSPPTSARLTHWFRLSDNDPFVIDTTTIDGSTFTRRKLDLPSGHSWAASGNRGVALLLGHTETQAVMYSGTDEAQRYHGLAADEVNTVEFGMSGLDETAGTGDDYTIELIYVDNCAEAEIEVRYLAFDPGDTGVGRCTADLLSLAPAGQLDIHHTLVPAPAETRILVEINSDKDWNFGVFNDGFEDGTTSSWSMTVP